MVGQLGEGFLLDLQKKMGGWHFTAGDIGPEADVAEKQDGSTVHIFQMNSLAGSKRGVGREGKIQIFMPAFFAVKGFRG